MRDLLQRTARNFILLRAVTDIKNKANQIGIDNVKTLVKDGRSITEIYLSDCPPDKKVQKVREANALVEMGITPEEIWKELIRQMPELAPIIEGKDDYIKSEMKKIEAFIKGQ